MEMDDFERIIEEMGKSEKFSENPLNFTPVFLLISESPLRPHLENLIVQSSGTSRKVLL